MSPELLFPRPGSKFLALLAALPKFLDAAMPLRQQHRRELPRDIRELSHLLTDERGDLRRDYLADPAALSAYMRYFLPWNIYRLGVLFTGLALDPGGDDPGAGATVIDLGTGPLTAPLALWMARPRLRRRALNFVCVDRAPKPMRLGLDALKLMAEAKGQGLPPWKVTLVKSPLDARLREKADLLIMANALNEVLHRGEGSDLLEDAGALAGHLSSMLTPTGQLLVVEPGVRPSSHLLAALRRGLLHQGLNPLAPCPHTGPCPMSGRGYTAWCHFNFESDSAPAWLKKLSELAKLPKDNVSLSFLHFSRKGRKLEAAPGRSLVRAVSGPLELPNLDGSRRYGQYACSERGLTLLSLPRRHLVPLPGTLLEAAWPELADKDAKSGAMVLPLGDMVRPTPHGPEFQPEPELEPKPVKEAKPPRLPSERPLERVKKPRPKAGAARKPAPARPAGAPEDRPAGKPEGRSPGKQPSKQEGKPAGKPANAGPDMQASTLESELEALREASKAERRPHGSMPGGSMPGGHMPGGKTGPKPKAKKPGKPGAGRKGKSRAERKGESAPAKPGKPAAKKPGKNATRKKDGTGRADR